MCAKLSAKVRKTRIIRLRKRYFFCGYCHFSLCESSKILYKILKHNVPKQLTSAASFSDKPRLVAQHLLPSSPKWHAFLAQKQCRFWCKNVRFFVISADEMDGFQLLLVACGSLSSWYSACLQKRFLLLDFGLRVRGKQKITQIMWETRKNIYRLDGIRVSNNSSANQDAIYASKYRRRVDDNLKWMGKTPQNSHRIHITQWKKHKNTKVLCPTVAELAKVI